MRVVLDTNVLARSTKNATGPARGCFLRFEAQQHSLLFSAYLLAELARVLTYPRLMARHGLTPDELREFLAAVETAGEMIATPLDSLEAIVSADPDDGLANTFARALTGYWAPYAWCEIFYRFNSNKTISVHVEGSAMPSLSLYVDWKIPLVQQGIVPEYSMLGAAQADVLGFLQTIGWGCRPAPRRPGNLTWSGTATTV